MNEGIELFSEQFIVDMRMFDENNKNNLHSLEILAKNKDFGINQIQQVQGQMIRSAIVSKHAYS